MDKLRSKLAVINKQSITLRSFERDADTVRNLLEDFLSRKEELGSIAEIQQSNARIISRANVPYEPVFPRKGTIMVLVTIVATLLGLLVVFLREQFVKAFRSGSDLEKSIGASPLGAVPKSSLAKNAHTAFIKKPFSDFSESLRTLYLNIIQNNTSKPPKLVLITSSLENEGVTTIAVGLSHAAKHTTHAKIAIVDMNFNKPTVHSYFNSLDNKPGVYEFLQGRTTCKAIEHIDPTSNISIFHAGNPIGTPF